MNEQKPQAELSNEQQRRQKRGAIITASIIGAIAFGIFLLTLYLNR